MILESVVVAHTWSTFSIDSAYPEPKSAYFSVSAGCVGLFKLAREETISVKEDDGCYGKSRINSAMATGTSEIGLDKPLNHKLQTAASHTLPSFLNRSTHKLELPPISSIPAFLNTAPLWSSMAANGGSFLRSSSTPSVPASTTLPSTYSLLATPTAPSFLRPSTTLETVTVTPPLPNGGWMSNQRSLQYVMSQFEAEQKGSTKKVEVKLPTRAELQTETENETGVSECKDSSCYLCTHGIQSLLDSEDQNLNSKSLGCREVVLAILSYLTLRHPKNWYTLNQDIYPLLLTHSHYIPQKSHHKRTIKRALQDTLSHNRRYFKSARKELNQNGRWKLTKMYRKWLTKAKGDQYWEIAPDSDASE
ncbi:hypothetical protein PROFUN_14232 [Planoprotostelium fungivorum]|uniref:Uncharacterized protein n=1 Tax=Planoprotostelium fungivorum TaxID=1890364 RepID=A0A2P6N0Q5_9EUKA|nr:hypothetical protein PROFUN_14232 [Planoprotostelium fungivorum]